MCFTFQLIPIFCSLFSYCTNSFSIFLCRDFPPKFLADMAEEPRVLRLVRQLADSSWQKRAEAVEELVADGKARMIWMVGTWEKHDSHTHTRIHIHMYNYRETYIYIYIYIPWNSYYQNILVVCVGTILFGRFFENQALHKKHIRTWWKLGDMRRK